METNRFDFYTFSRIWSFLVACVGIYSANHPEWLYSCNLFIFGYMATDLLQSAEIDMRIHHVNSLAALILYFWKARDTKYMLATYPTVLRVEYSTLFYAGTPMLVKFVDRKYAPAIKTVSLLFFVPTFLKYRIVDYTQQLILNPNTYYDDSVGVPLKAGLIMIFYVFYALNLYWTCLIFRKVYRFAMGSYSERKEAVS
jgi:hypothetical protein